MERRSLFISHATPEDNVFTLWLGAKLSALGYEVWADVLRLAGGDDWERKLESAIREKACKVLLVANAVSVNKQGVRNEIHIADAVGRGIGDRAFIIPLKLAPFNAPFLIAHAQYIDFESGWAAGLKELVRVLNEVYAVPRARAISLDLWTGLQVLQGKPVTEAPEALTSNWLEVRRLPASIFFVHPECAKASKAVPTPYPAVEYGEGLLSAERTDVRGVLVMPTADFLARGWPALGLDREGARRLFTVLANRALGNLFESKGLKAFEMSNRQTTWWAGDSVPSGRIPFRWPSFAGSRQLHGHSPKRGVHWHFGVSTAFRSGPFPHVRVKSHLLFTADGVTPLDDPKRMHRLRRSFAKAWRNARWRDMMLAMLYWIGDGTTVLNVPMGSRADLVLSLPPLAFSSPVSVSDVSATDEDSDDPEIEFANDDEDLLGDEEDDYARPNAQCWSRGDS